MTPTKRKVSISLDDGLVEELERHRLLMAWLDQLDEEYGPVDESLVEKYVVLLGSSIES